MKSLKLKDVVIKADGLQNKKEAKTSAAWIFIEYLKKRDLVDQSEMPRRGPSDTFSTNGFGMNSILENTVLENRENRMASLAGNKVIIDKSIIEKKINVDRIADELNKVKLEVQTNDKHAETGGRSSTTKSEEVLTEKID